MLPAILFFTLLAVLVIGLLVAGSLFLFIWTRAVPLALAVLGGLGISALLNDGAGPTAATTIIASLALFVVLEAIRAPFARRRALRARYDIDVAATPTGPRPSNSNVPGATRLDRALDALALEADWAGSRLAVARESCRLFLAAAERASGDGEAGDFVPRIRNGIPEHIDLSLANARMATATERRAILDECIADIEHVAAEADRIRARLQPGLRREMRLHSQYLRHKSTPDPFAID